MRDSSVRDVRSWEFVAQKKKKRTFKTEKTKNSEEALDYTWPKICLRDEGFTRHQIWFGMNVLLFECSVM